MRFGTLAALLFAPSALLVAAPAAAQSYASSGMRPAPELLRAGQYAWYQEPRLIRANAVAEPVSITISIPAQLAYVFRGSTLLGVSTVSTGKPGHDTPVGEFTILQKKVFHRSNLYSNAPMPYMQRLTWDGIALHAGHLPGYPASHGCIRFPKAFARTLYGLTEMGGLVRVIDTWPELAPPEPPPVLLADARMLGGEAFNVVTMRGDPPSGVPAPRPVSWVTGPAREIVQPIPGGGK